MIASERYQKAALQCGMDFLSALDTVAEPNFPPRMDARLRAMNMAMLAAQTVILASITRSGENTATIQGLGIAVGSYFAQLPEDLRLGVLEIFEAAINSGGERTDRDLSCVGRA